MSSLKVAKGGKGSSPKKKPPKKTPEEKREALRRRNHSKAIKSVFEGAGFSLIPTLTNAEFVFKEKKCDLDRVYVLDNVVVIVEETYTSANHLSDHLEGKKTIFDYINSDRAAFIAYLRAKFPDFSSAVSSVYHNHHVQLRIVYAPLNRLKDAAKIHVKDVQFLDYHILRYFFQLSRAIRLSCVYELLEFLSVSPAQFKSNVAMPKIPSTAFPGSVLPSLQSHFPEGFKVVSFYTSAARLMERSFVLRKNSWRDSTGAYQRALSIKKIGAIRRFLLAKSGVFVNNIIATLPTSTRFESDDGTQVDPSKLLDVQPISVNLPNAFNSVGLIDGQHRVFSYYEGGPDEAEIALLRDQQNLLVTGIVFPPGLDEISRDRFAAQLFLQINSRQTKPPPELTQEIDVLLRPNAVTSMARRILSVMGQRGPLEGEFVSPLSETGRIRTASVVNYALVPLVRPSSAESLFSQWTHTNKQLLANAKANDTSIEDLLNAYVEYCVVEINRFIGAFRFNLPKDRWSPSKKDEPGLLSVTFVNGLLHALRRLAGAGKLADADFYREKLATISDFDFQGYTSSSYSEMGYEIAEEYFGISKSELPASTE